MVVAAVHDNDGGLPVATEVADDVKDLAGGRLSGIAIVWTRLPAASRSSRRKSPGAPAAAVGASGEGDVVGHDLLAEVEHLRVVAVRASLECTMLVRIPSVTLLTGCLIGSDWRAAAIEVADNRRAKRPVDWAGRSVAKASNSENWKYRGDPIDCTRSTPAYPAPALSKVITEPNDPVRDTDWAVPMVLPPAPKKVTVEPLSRLSGQQAFAVGDDDRLKVVAPGQIHLPIGVGSIHRLTGVGWPKSDSRRASSQRRRWRRVVRLVGALKGHIAGMSVCRAANSAIATAAWVSETQSAAAPIGARKVISRNS